MELNKTLLDQPHCSGAVVCWAAATNPGAKRLQQGHPATVRLEQGLGLHRRSLRYPRAIPPRDHHQRHRQEGHRRLQLPHRCRR